MPVGLTGCWLHGCVLAADRLGLHTPLPAVRSDEHALSVDGGGQSQPGSPEPPRQRPADGSSSLQASKADGAAAPFSPAATKQQGSQRRLPVVLRVEVASKFSAQVGRLAVLRGGRLPAGASPRVVWAAICS